MESPYVIIVICLFSSIFFTGVILVFTSIRIVQADTRLSVYRLGRYIGDKGPGIVLTIPFIDRVVLKKLDNVEKNSPFE